MTEEVLSREPAEGSRADELVILQEKMLRRIQPQRFASPDDVTVVIPTLNEKEGIAKVIDELRKEGFERILVVDGYSNDGTDEIAEAKGAIVIHQHGPGKAGALATAIEAVDTPYLLVMDGDDTYKASDAMRLLEHAAGFDEVIGARKNGRKNIPSVNRLGNWMISKTFKLLFDQPITDVLSGMYLLRTEMAKELPITSTSFDIEVDIASGMATGGRVTEVPISYGDRLGTQKLKPSDGGRILSTLFWMTYYRSPAVVYSAIASLVGIPGLVILGWTLYEKAVSNVWHSGWALLSVFLLLFASQGIASMIGSLQSKRAENRILREIRRTRS